jgi:hypothetical protein
MNVEGNFSGVTTEKGDVFKKNKTHILFVKKYIIYFYFLIENETFFDVIGEGCGPSTNY